MPLNVGNPLLENKVKKSVLAHFLMRKEVAQCIVFSSIFPVLVSADRFSQVAEAGLGFEAILSTRIQCGPRCLVLHWHFHFTVANLNDWQGTSLLWYSIRHYC